jgi:hypothetical protein
MKIFYNHTNKSLDSGYHPSKLQNVKHIIHAVFPHLLDGYLKGKKKPRNQRPFHFTALLKIENMFMMW